MAKGDALRIYPLSWSNRPFLRIELYGCIFRKFIWLYFPFKPVYKFDMYLQLYYTVILYN